MPRSDLEDLRAQLDWAESQFEVLEIGIQAFRDSKPYRTFVEVDAQSGEKALRLEATQVVPRKLRASTGATIGAIRSSLDHLAVVLAKRNNAVRVTDVYFPISKSEAVFLDDGLKKIKRLAVADIEAIKKLKPYGGGNDSLFALHLINTGHKHTNLVAMGGMSGAVAINQLEASNVSILTGLRLEHRVPVTIMRGTFGPNYQLGVAIEITFSDIPAFQGSSLIAIVRQFHDTATSIVNSFDS
jgi:hypothetical protein